MAAYTFPNNIKYLFAFSHCLPGKPSYIALLDQFDLQVEYVRLGILDNVNTTSTGGTAGNQSPWRICYANRDYRLCNTYGRVLIMPARMTDEELGAVAQFRSGQRLPVLCWGDKESGATMWRCSQPKCGMSGSCAYDERFLEQLAQSCAYQRTPLGQRRQTEAGAVLNIVDCRPKTSAMANRAAGAGYESQANYPSSRIDFYNIPNIHVMRDSYRNLMSLVVTSSISADLTFSKSVEDTQWLNYCRLILKAAIDTTAFIRKGQPVLVHCSHGWDRTAQVCSLSQLLLDSYYRTMDGFRVLVEKEWCSFGHPFQMRCQHGKDKANRQDDQWSPVFLQFLDCVYQIQKQHKHYFEFNARFLVALADQVYSCRFGTFLFDCDKERVSAA
jgi:rhodanese-related sulfurtransferase